jgi:hypothetical protein
VLPRDVSSWRAARASRRASYARLVRDLVVVPSRDAAPDAAVDHPLALEPATSAWARHFAHAETREQIGRDIERTQRDMHWFSAPGAGAHRAAMARALFVFAATNASVRYVQGMNELMAPIYYLAATAPSEQESGSGGNADGDDGGGDGDCAATDADADADADDAGEAVSAAEACAFSVFVPLLGELRDLFCARLDDSAGGVAGTLGALSAHLAAADPDLAAHLEGKCAINPQFYAFRWITTALTQEFPLPDALRLWDALLADEAGPRDALTRAAAAMVLHLRPQLMAGDFASNLKLLQAFPPTDGACVLTWREGRTWVLIFALFCVRFLCFAQCVIFCEWRTRCRAAWRRRRRRRRAARRGCWAAAARRRGSAPQAVAGVAPPRQGSSRPPAGRRVAASARRTG